MLATMGPEHWGRCWRLSGWKIGDDLEDLLAPRVGTTLEIMLLGVKATMET